MSDFELIMALFCIIALLLNKLKKGAQGIGKAGEKKKGVRYAHNLFNALTGNLFVLLV